MLPFLELHTVLQEQVADQTYCYTCMFLALGEKLLRYIHLARKYQAKSPLRSPYSKIPLEDFESITTATLMNPTMRCRSK